MMGSQTFEYYRDTGMQMGDKALPQKQFLSKPNHRFANLFLNNVKMY